MATPTDDEKRMYLMFHGWTHAQGSSDAYQIWISCTGGAYFLKDAYNTVREEHGQFD